jgi:signal recognition particle subunit SRP54
MSLNRKKRIAKGCGQSLDQINLFVRNFEQMRKMMHQFANMPAGKMGMPPGMGVPKGFR